MKGKGKKLIKLCKDCKRKATAYGNGWLVNSNTCTCIFEPWDKQNEPRKTEDADPTSSAS